MEYLKNENLETIRPDWKGNPFRDGQFQYPDDPFYPSFRKLLRWQFSANPQRAKKKADDWRPALVDDFSYLEREDDFIVWLGHACFLIQLNGLRLITDPVLFDLPFIPRLVQPPLPPDRLTGIDYILLSHDHRDHCDKKSLQTLLRHNRPRKILAPLRLSSVIGGWVDGTPVEEAAWYQAYNVKNDALQILFLPSRHWCRRGLFDFNQVLWGSFLIRYAGYTLYFGSDSGPGDHFAEIGQRFPCIDLALLGIGAYRPDYMMQEIHTSPGQAAEAFRQLGAKRLLPMHYGTYDLSDEPVSEPYRLIRRHFAENSEQEKLILPAVGEAVSLQGAPNN